MQASKAATFSPKSEQKWPLEFRAILCLEALLSANSLSAKWEKGLELANLKTCSSVDGALDS